MQTINERIETIRKLGKGVILARDTGPFYVAHVGNGQWREFRSLQGLSEYAERINAGIVYYDANYR